MKDLPLSGVCMEWIAVNLCYLKVRNLAEKVFIFATLELIAPSYSKRQENA